MQKEDPESITTISQPHILDEYEYKSYEELSQEFKKVYPAAARAFELIPQMYNRLTRVDGLRSAHSNAQIETAIYRKRKRCILPLFGEVVVLFILV